MPIERNIQSALIYWDTSDPDNPGWASNVVIDDEHNSDALDCRDIDAPFGEVFFAFGAVWRGQADVLAATTCRWESTQTERGWHAILRRVPGQSPDL